MLSNRKILWNLRSEVGNVLREVQEYRLGRVLTIIDASIQDSEQRKAIKDLVKDAFHSPEYFSTSLPDVFHQFCKRIGIEVFKSKDEETDFLGIGPRVEKDYFPEKYLHENGDDSII